jgi:hypothetical protein
MQIVISRLLRLLRITKGPTRWLNGEPHRQRGGRMGTSEHAPATHFMRVHVRSTRSIFSNALNFCRRGAHTNALRCAFLHLCFCMLTMRTIENEYLRNPFDVRDSADKLHWLLAMARGRSGSLILHEIHPSSRVDLLFEGAKLRSRVHK